jgi:hypothetical protein
VIGRIRTASVRLASPESLCHVLIPDFPTLKCYPCISPFCGSNAELPILDIGHCDTSPKQACAPIFCRNLNCRLQGLGTRSKTRAATRRRRDQTGVAEPRRGQQISRAKSRARGMCQRRFLVLVEPSDAYLVGASEFTQGDSLSVLISCLPRQNRNRLGCADSAARLHRISPGLHASDATAAYRSLKVPRQVMSTTARLINLPCNL